MFDGTLNNLNDLRAIAPSLRRPGMTFFVLNIEEGLASGTYTFDATLTGSPLGSVFVAPESGGGIWVKQGQLIHFAASRPTIAPLLRGVTWVASLTSPTRTVIWESRGNSSLSDWHPVDQPPFLYNANPTGILVPDFVGQTLIRTDEVEEYVATSTTSVDWLKVGPSGGGGGGGY